MRWQVTPTFDFSAPPHLSAALRGLHDRHRRRSTLHRALGGAGTSRGAGARAPALTIVPHIDDEALIARTRELIADPPQVVVASTGVGFRGWMEAADEAGLLDDLHAALSTAQIVARGPKARGAIQQAGLTADWVAESETSTELGEYLLAEGGKRPADRRAAPWIGRRRIGRALRGARRRGGEPHRLSLGTSTR